MALSGERSTHTMLMGGKGEASSRSSVFPLQIRRTMLVLVVTCPKPPALLIKTWPKRRPPIGNLWRSMIKWTKRRHILLCKQFRASGLFKVLTLSLNFRPEVLRVADPDSKVFAKLTMKRPKASMVVTHNLWVMAWVLSSKKNLLLPWQRLLGSV